MAQPETAPLVRVMAPEPRFTILPLIPVPVVTIRPLLPDRLLMLMVFEASNVPSDVNAKVSRTAAWLGRAQRQNATVQARIIHLTDTVFSATVPLLFYTRRVIGLMSAQKPALNEVRNILMSAKQRQLRSC